MEAGAIDRSTPNAWSIWSKAPHAGQIIDMIENIFPLFSTTTHAFYSNPNDKNRISKMSKYFVKVHAMSKMQAKIKEYHDRMSVRRKEAKLLMGLTGLFIQSSCKEFEFVIVNALTDATVYAVRVSRNMEVTDEMFINPDRATRLTMDMCEHFRPALAPSRIVIGTPPPPLSATEQEALRINKERKKAQRKKATEVFEEGPDDGAGSSDDYEVVPESSKDSVVTKRKHAGKTTAHPSTATPAASTAHPSTATPAASTAAPASSTATQAAQDQQAKPAEPVKPTLRDGCKAGGKTSKREGFEVPEEVGFPVQTTNWLDADGKLVYEEVVEARAGPVVIPNSALKSVSDILKLVGPKQVITLLGQAGYKFSELNELSKKMKENHKGVRISKELESTLKEAPERAARMQRETMDMTFAIEHNGGWISTKHISVVVLLRKRLKAFHDNGEGKTDSESDCEPVKAKVGRPPSKKRSQETQEIRAPRLPDKPIDPLEERKRVESRVERDPDRRFNAKGEEERFSHALGKWEKVRAKRTTQEYKRKRVTREFDKTEIRRIKTQAKANLCIMETIPISYIPITHALNPEKYPDEYVTLHVPDHSNTIRMALGLIQEGMVGAQEYTELFLLIQKDMFLANSTLTHDNLHNMGVEMLPENTWSIKALEPQIMGDRVKMKAFMSLYDCSHKEMCITWNQLAERSVYVQGEFATHPLHAEVADRFAAWKPGNKRVKPFLIPIGLTWTCNTDGSFGHHRSLCKCGGGKLNIFADPLFELFMTCQDRRLVISIAVPGNLLVFAKTPIPCKTFDEMFSSKGVKEFLGGRGRR